MSNVVIGKDVVLYVTVDSEDLAITCWSTFQWQLTNEMIGKTDVNAGLFRKRRVRISDCGCSVSGLLTIENEPGFVSGFWFLQESVRRSELELKFVFTDEAGVIKELTGTFVIESLNISGDVSVFAESEINFLGTGGIEMSTVDPPSGEAEPTCDEVQPPLYLSLLEGETSVSSILLAGEGVEVLEVCREHTQVDVITSGTPNSVQVLWVGGDLTFLNSGNPGGEDIYVLYKVAVS